LTNNASQECHCGRIDPTSYLTKLIKIIERKNHDRSKGAETKTTTIKDRNEKRQQKKLNLESRNQSTVKQRKEAQKLKA
jgi:hypothetical protein